MLYQPSIPASIPCTSTTLTKREWSSTWASKSNSYQGITKRSRIWMTDIGRIIIRSIGIGRSHRQYAANNSIPTTTMIQSIQTFQGLRWFCWSRLRRSLGIAWLLRPKRAPTSATITSTGSSIAMTISAAGAASRNAWLTRFAKVQMSGLTLRRRGIGKARGLRTQSPNLPKDLKGNK